MEVTLQNQLGTFRLPKYEEIPAVGLYLEQVVKYIEDALAPIGLAGLTPSMVSNYVKNGLIESPVRKQYSREQIAYLLFVAMAKSIVPLEDIRLLFSVQRQAYDSKTAYDYFCAEFINVLYFVFGLKPSLDQVGADSTYQKKLLRHTIIAVAHKIYLEKGFELVRAARAEAAK